VTLDPTFVPEKYHPFIIPALRRVYLNADPSRASVASRQLQEQLTAVKKENEDLASKLKGRDRDIKLLMTKCESNMAAAATHAKGERDVRLENERLRREINQIAEQLRTIEVELSEREHRTGPSGEGEGRPVDDPRWGHPQNQSRSRSVPCA
jgi:predicted RNase H-like nuclease (RuvC/YqgF family)